MEKLIGLLCYEPHGSELYILSNLCRSHVRPKHITKELYVAFGPLCDRNFFFFFFFLMRKLKLFSFQNSGYYNNSFIQSLLT